MTTQTRPDLKGSLTSCFRQTVWVLLALIVLLNVTNAVAIHHRPWENHQSSILMLGTEQSPAAWISSAMLLIVALLAVYCRAIARPADRAWWVVVAAVVLTMSLDETAGLHERIGNALNGKVNMTLSFGWIVPAIIAGLLAVALLRTAWRLPKPTRNGLLIGFGVFVGGASLIDLVGGYHEVYFGKANYLHYIIESLEENCEMLGELLLMITLARHIRAHGFAASTTDGTLSITKDPDHDPDHDLPNHRFVA